MTDKQQDAKTEAQGVERARHIGLLDSIERRAINRGDTNECELIREARAYFVALSTPASHDAQQPAAFLTLSEASEGSEWPEAPLQLTEVGRKLPHGTHALYAQQPAVVGGGGFDAWWKSKRIDPEFPETLSDRDFAKAAWDAALTPAATPGAQKEGNGNG